MPTYKITVSELLHRITTDMEFEADSLEDAMAQLADLVPSPDFYWSATTRDMMVLELSADDEKILVDTRNREDGTTFQIWPTKMIEDGRVWEGTGEDGGEYLMENLPRSVQALLEAEEEED